MCKALVKVVDEFMLYASVPTPEVPAHVIVNTLALGASIHNGALREDYDLHKPATIGKVKLDDFAQEFAAAF